MSDSQVGSGAVVARPLLRASGLNKSFDGAQALRSVDVDIFAGEVHGLVGPNGAGKSTFIKVLAGSVHPDSGSVRLDGGVVEIPTPRTATELGFAFLHQELSLVPKFTVLENLGMGLVRSRATLIDFRQVKARAERVAADLEFDFTLSARTDGLSVAQQWMVALGRSLMSDARLIAFDEPTGSLSASETRRLFSVIKTLTNRGVAVLYVSHRLEEIELLARRVTAFRDGQVVKRFVDGEITPTALAQAITGGEPPPVSAQSTPASKGRIVLEARDVGRPPLLNSVSFAVHAGEVVGIAGLVGAGRSELARVLMGADRPTRGSIWWEGKELRKHTPHKAARLGFGFVPEERRSQGLFLDERVDFNLNIASAAALVGRVGLLVRSRARRQANSIAEAVELRPRRIDIDARRLSGGNQQKLVIGRWLIGRRRLLILDEPTRGIDIATRAQIHRLQRELADDGMAVLLIDSDFRELLQCDRVLVMREGSLVAELGRSEISEHRMLQESYGVARSDSQRGALNE